MEPANGSLGTRRPSMTQHYETVDHPAHYGRYGVEAIQIAEQMNFNLGNALKYIMRVGEKPGVDPVEDLRKAVWYLQREIKRVEQVAPPVAFHQADVYGEKP